MKKYKILFLDDDVLVAKAAELFLKPICSKLTFTYSGTECLDELSKDNDFDIILIDFMLPDMTGLNVLEEIKSRDAVKNIPVLIQTGVSNITLSDIHELGASILFKPYSKKELHSSIDKLVS